ncbi:hypothetical protein TL16_g04639 [Triparma laevis f. inornata]|uniref:FHA domain-containing protein n=1 Tax=Triparma laevis f. inornata TaxID=1714386 RepID=A0A9W7E3Z3_9STRA|nr:hypothetical protein TL16_g04639 [Triparma laevis f. inornata]
MASEAERSALEDELSVPSSASPPIGWYLESSSVVHQLTSSVAGGRSCIIGRNEACDVKLTEHKTVSRKHAVVYAIGDKVILRDCMTKKTVKVVQCEGSGGGESRLGKGQTLVLKEGMKLTFAASEEEFVVKYPKDAGPIQSNSNKADADSNGSDDVTEEVSDKPKIDTTNMTARQIREAEIKAMMDSLDSTQTYTKYVPTEKERLEREQAEKEMEAAEERGKGDSKFSQLNIPISHEVVINSGERVVSSVASDPSGGRFVAGSFDYNFRMYDFGGMDQSHKAFRDVTADDGNPVISLSYSPSGDKFICASSSAQPKIFSRDGKEIVHFVKGDVYITDVTNTKGHTAAVTGCQWHPKDKNVVMTSSLDGSVRLWKLDGKTLFGRLISAEVLRVKNQRGVRCGCSCASFDREGKWIVHGTKEGGVVLFEVTNFRNRPTGICWDAHSGTVTNISFSNDNKMFASRGEDGNVCIFDFEKMKGANGGKVKCEYKIENVETGYEMSNCCFSPDNKLLCVGSNVRPNSEESSFLKFLWAKGAEGGNLAAEVAVSKGVSVVNVAWPNKLNQIICGLSNGEVKVYYDPMVSNKGAMLSSKRKARKVNELDALLFSRSDGVSGDVFTPNALPLFQDKEKKSRKQLEKEGRRAVPEQQESGFLAGRDGSAANFNQDAVDRLGLMDSEKRLQRDPRAALFKYNDVNPTGVVTGLEKQQPTILANTTAEEEQDKRTKRQKTS